LIRLRNQATNRHAPSCIAACTWIVISSVLSLRFGIASEPTLDAPEKSVRSSRFAQDIVPLLTRAGCNSGACHGAAAGRGYLQLSLFGCRPREDYLALANSPGGRLINLADPDSSLLLMKPSGQLEHGGGERLEMDSPEYRTLFQWIKAGAAPDRLRAVTGIATEPPETLEVLVGKDAAIDIQVRFENSDFENADASRIVIEGAAEASGASDSQSNAALSFTRSDSGIRLQATKAGYFPITVRYGPVAQAIAVWAIERPTQRPETNPRSPTRFESPTETSSGTSRNRVDRWLEPVVERLHQSGVIEATAPLCSNSTLARRMYVDLFGRLPSLDEWEAAIQILETSGPAELADQMLGREEFAWQAQRQILGWGNVPEAEQYARLRREIASSIAENDSLRELAEGILKVKTPSTAFNDLHRVAAGPRERTELVASMWMGVQVGCAKCHDHPLDHWTQDDYFAMAACWAPIETGGGVRRVDGRTTTDLRTEQSAVPLLPGGAAAGEQPDHALVDWLVADDNPYFTPNLVNRIWDWLMGQGIVMPVNDFRSTNLPIAPELLRGLTAELENNDYSLRHLVRMIVCSEVYRRSSATDAPALALRAFAARSSKPIDIPTETLVAQALGIDLDGQSEHRGSTMMATAGDGCSRASACVDPTSQRIELVRGKVISQAISLGLQQAQASLPGRSKIDVLSDVHQRLFGRAATREETANWQELLDRHVRQINAGQEKAGLSSLRSQKAVSEFAEALVWSWVVSDDFLQLH